MYTSIQQFIKDFTQEKEITLSLFKAIPNDKLRLKPNDDIRSLHRLVWHILITHGEMLGKAGLTINCPHEHDAPVENINEICRLYEISANSVLQIVNEKWTDEDLSAELNMYGENWSKGTILSVLIKHEVHHRGQLSVVMRLNDIKVPSIYGPAKEDWAKYNMPTAE
jgi:uncharacterized damage-inducible protein DinB